MLIYYATFTHEKLKTSRSRITWELSMIPNIIPSKRKIIIKYYENVKRREICENYEINISILIFKTI